MELGFDVAPTVKNAWNFNASVTGYFGKQEGVTGNTKAWQVMFFFWEFL